MQFWLNQVYGTCGRLENMAVSVNTLLDRFQLFRVPSLPPLLSKQIASSSQQNSSDQPLLAALLEDDVFLYAKVLGTVKQMALKASFNTNEVISILGNDEVEAIISQAAMQSTNMLMSPARLNFFKTHWRQSNLTKIIARELASEMNLNQLYQEKAEFACQFLNLGEIVLEDLFSERYRFMYESVRSGARQVEVEQSSLGFNHAELGSVLLQRWGLDSFICDAVNYHQETLDQILDASTLVRLCWLANLISTRVKVDKVIIEAGEQLFGLNQETLITVHSSAATHAQKKIDELGLLFKAEPKFDSPLQAREPLQSHLVESVWKRDEEQYSELSELVNNINLFNAARSNLKVIEGASNLEKYGEELGTIINLLFGFHDCAVFYKADQHSELNIWVSSIVSEEIKELKIKCETGRSIIANCFLTGKEQIANKDDKMTVIDKQIISMLGKSAIVCDPLVLNKEVVAVLVIGIPDSLTPHYIQQEKIRNLLKAEILEGLSQIEVNKGSNEQTLNKNLIELDYEQRISDTIHEVNNPLSIIKNYLQLLSKKQKGDTSFIEEISVIRTEIDRVSKLLANLKDNVSAVDEESEANEVDVNLVINDLTKVISASMFSDQIINFELNLSPELPLISFKESAFKQIVTNLLKNAIEALGQKGAIIIDTYGNIFLNGRHYIQVNISDDGPGISPEEMNRLFMPGQSTKGEGHSGSGLAIVKNLIESMGGQISCRSDSNGTRFSMFFLRKMQFQKRSIDRRLYKRPMS